MLWRAEKMAQILALGMPTILCPNSHFYFDYPQRAEDATAPWQLVITPETVRSFRMPQVEHVLGVQGNLWAEDIPTAERLFYMAFPRAQVMAEAFWLQNQGR